MSILFVVSKETQGPSSVFKRASSVDKDCAVFYYKRTRHERHHLFTNKKGFIYLSLVTDAWSRKIVGYNLSRNLKAEGCIKAFQMAFKVRLYPNRPLIHHSDRGIQYCCDAYVQLLMNQRVQISMNQNGSPYDNAIAERVNGILKQEFDLYQSFESFQNAKQTVEQAIIRYNQLRPHFSCELKTPQSKHASINPIKCKEQLVE